MAPPSLQLLPKMKNLARILVLYSSKYGSYQHLETPPASVFSDQEVPAPLKCQLTVYQLTQCTITKDSNSYRHHSENLKEGVSTNVEFGMFA
jgi:hypothetical protein